MVTKVLVLGNKGGVGKTSFTCYIASIISQYGQRILLLDLSRREDSKYLLNYEYSYADDEIGEIYRLGETLDVVYCRIDNIEKIHVILNKPHFSKKYDIILVDPPALSLVKMRFLFDSCSEYLLVSAIDYLSWEILKQNLPQLFELQKHCSLHFRGIVLNCVQKEVPREIFQKIYQEVQPYLLSPIIPYDAQIEKLVWQRQTLQNLTSGQAVFSYLALANMLSNIWLQQKIQAFEQQWQKQLEVQRVCETNLNLEKERHHLLQQQNQGMQKSLEEKQLQIQTLEQQLCILENSKSEAVQALQEMQIEESVNSVEAQKRETEKQLFPLKERIDKLQQKLEIYKCQTESKNSLIREQEIQIQAQQEFIKIQNARLKDKEREIRKCLQKLTAVEMKYKWSQNNVENIKRNLRELTNDLS